MIHLKSVNHPNYFRTLTRAISSEKGWASYNNYS